MKIKNGEKETMMKDGVTMCCGYDFGTDASNKKNKILSDLRKKNYNKALR